MQNECFTLYITVYKVIVYAWLKNEMKNRTKIQKIALVDI